MEGALAKGSVPGVSSIFHFNELGSCHIEFRDRWARDGLPGFSQRERGPLSGGFSRFCAGKVGEYARTFPHHIDPDSYCRRFGVFAGVSLGELVVLR